MKKYDWDKQLRRELRRLTEDEREKILDYYNEIFEDKRDRGERETEIIASFGSPYAVADKILRENRDGERDRGYDGSVGVPPPRKYREDPGVPQYEYRGEKPVYGSSPYADERPRPIRYAADPKKDTDKGAGRILLFVLLLIVFWIPLLVIFIVVCSVLFSLIVAFLAVIAAGVAVTVFGFIDIAAGIGAGPGLISVGTGLLIVGLGCILCPLCLAFAKLVWRGLKAVFGGVSRWLRGRRA